MPSELGELIQQTRTIIDLFSKAKAAKLIRELVDLFLDMEAATGSEVCGWEGEEGGKRLKKREEGRRKRRRKGSSGRRGWKGKREKGGSKGKWDEERLETLI